MSKLFKRTKILATIGPATNSAEKVEEAVVEGGATTQEKEVKTFTQEELDRRQSQTNALGVLRDTMDVLGDIERKSTRLKIVKTYFQKILGNTEIEDYIQDEIDYVEKMEKEQETTPDDNNNPSVGGGGGPRSRASTMNDVGSKLGFEPTEENPNEPTEPTTGTEETTEVETETSSESDYLPSFAELGVNSEEL